MATPHETDPNSSFLPPALRAIANEVGELVKSRQETISVAETAAGGLISAALLSVPGASQYYLGGLTLYTLPSRIAFSHWTPDTVKGYSGPTTSIVAGLAEHARTTLESTTRNRTPGYVALAVAGESGTVTREVETGKTEREGNMNMAAFAVAGLELVRDVVKGDAKL
ncbi:competence/damage-inducible protein-like protein cinA [Mycena alexandri]|uniref:Competence/damage-inducible protein-like protein cinA n=1 Tax=Mycena alexandri TaxID=1745969 RepID=A0AAD6WWM6_9AGAR|nr:competence/damage-inducible protein-like protein cinA [Mycena alexandri]